MFGSGPRRSAAGCKACSGARHDRARRDGASGAGNRIFITGATGFLGSWIIAALVGWGVHVVATDISTDHARLSQLIPDLPPGLVDARMCDVTDTAALEALIAETRPTAIIHLAALQIPMCSTRPALGAAVNIGGQINIFEAARKFGIRRVVYTSSIAAKPRGQMNAPSNLYGVFKKTGEEIARLYWQDHGLPSLGLRPYIVYGVGRDDGETSAITRAIEAAALGHDYEIPFTTRSSFQYSGDIAEIFVRAAQATWQGRFCPMSAARCIPPPRFRQRSARSCPRRASGWRRRCGCRPPKASTPGPWHDVIGDWAELPPQEGFAAPTTSIARSRHAGPGFQSDHGCASSRPARGDGRARECRARPARSAARRPRVAGRDRRPAARRVMIERSPPTLIA